MARMSGNDECPSRDFGDMSQFTNWVLDSTATCNIMPQVSYFITVSLEDTDKNILKLRTDIKSRQSKKGKYK